MNKEKLTKEEIALFCLSMQQLVCSGISPADGLAFLAEDEAVSQRREMLQEMALQADEGMSLSEVLKNSAQFPEYVTGLLRVGEETGRMEEALGALAGYYEGRAQLERRLRAAVLYPVLLSVVLLAVVLVLLMWVLPIFNEAYLQLGSSLTGLAGGLLALGGFLRRTLPVWAALLLLPAGGVIWGLSSENGRDTFKKYCMEKWGCRGILRQLTCARFGQALAMGLRAGLSSGEAVELSAQLTTEDIGFHSACKSCMEQLDGGASLSAVLRENGLLSAADSRLLEAGIRSGTGDVMMEKIAQHLLEESEQALERMAARVEPTLVILLSVLVGGILCAVMLPLLQIMSAIG